MTDPAALETHVRLPLRWRDMDMLGHLNQAVYHELLEEARAVLMAELVARVDGSHATYVLARVELDYRHEVRKDHGEVEVVVRIGRVGTSSITLEHDVLLPDGIVAATGRTVLVGWELARGKRVLSDPERAALGAAPVPRKRSLGSRPPSADRSRSYDALDEGDDGRDDLVRLVSLKISCCAPS